MARVQIPAEHDGSLLSYLLTFSSSFTKMQEIKGCLDSVGQNIAQARVLIGQPLGLFACLTAEEEAARFLYLCLRKMKYNLPRYDRLTTHQDKARILGGVDKRDSQGGLIVIHVWMPPLVQGAFGRLEHVIGCFHVSGLKLRR